MPVGSLASTATTSCGHHPSHVTPEDPGFWGFKSSGTKLGKCRAGTQTKVLWPHHQWGREQEEWGGYQCPSKVPWCPPRQTALLLVKPDERWMLVMLWIKVQFPSSPLLLPLSCFLMHEQSYSPGWHHLHQLSSFLDQCQGPLYKNH